MAAMAMSALLLASCTGYNRTSIPNVPFLNIDVHKHEHRMSSSDRVCVFNGGDMITDTKTRYRNSGRFMYKMVVSTMEQYSIDGVVAMGANSYEDVAVVNMQEPARNNGCNIIAISKPIYWTDSQISPGNVGLNLDMYDTSSLELVNSVTLNARTEFIRDMFQEPSPIKPVIETYIDKIYTE